MGKIVTVEEIRSELAARREAGQQVVFTNGAFDLMHVGHLRYLEAARGLGDVLVVGLNSDISVKAYKDPRRPIVAEDERATMLAGLACVDYVVMFDAPTAARLVVELRPDIYVKGGDYAAGGKPLPEAAIVEGYGGKVEIVPLVPGRSTSALIERILALYCGKAD